MLYVFIISSAINVIVIINVLLIIDDLLLKATRRGVLRSCRAGGGGCVVRPGGRGLRAGTCPPLLSQRPACLGPPGSASRSLSRRL